jgi:four helix bundle protein
MSLENFEDLECYKAARLCRLEVSKFTKLLPAEEKFRLKDQMIRASRSVTANMAEGFGRHHHQENLQFCRQARGSLYEMIEHFHTALDENYLDDETHKLRVAEHHTAIRILNGYIRYLTSIAGKKTN